MSSTNNPHVFKTAVERNTLMADWFATDSLINRFEAEDNVKNDEAHDRACERLDELTKQYTDQLPKQQVSVCPFCGATLSIRKAPSYENIQKYKRARADLGAL